MLEKDNSLEQREWKTTGLCLPLATLTALSYVDMRVVLKSWLILIYSRIARYNSSLAEFSVKDYCNLIFIFELGLALGERIKVTVAHSRVYWLTTPVNTGFSETAQHTLCKYVKTWRNDCFRTIQGIRMSRGRWIQRKKSMIELTAWK